MKTAVGLDAVRQTALPVNTPPSNASLILVRFAEGGAIEDWPMRQA